MGIGDTAEAGIVVFTFAALRVIRRADVELAQWIFENVYPERGSFVFQAPRVGLEPTTCRLTAGRCYH